MVYIDYQQISLLVHHYLIPSPHRMQHPTPAHLQSVAQPPFPWDQDQYFKPVLAEDPLLQYDFEGSVGEEEGRVDNAGKPDGVGGKDESALLQRYVFTSIGRR